MLIIGLLGGNPDFPRKKYDPFEGSTGAQDCRYDISPRNMHGFREALTSTWFFCRKYSPTQTL